MNILENKFRMYFLLDYNDDIIKNITDNEITNIKINLIKKYDIKNNIDINYYIDKNCGIIFYAIKKYDYEIDKLIERCLQDYNLYINRRQIIIVNNNTKLEDNNAEYFIKSNN